jgi:hypothetical protein
LAEEGVPADDATERRALRRLREILGDADWKTESMP